MIKKIINNMLNIAIIQLSVINILNVIYIIQNIDKLMIL